MYSCMILSGYQGVYLQTVSDPGLISYLWRADSHREQLGCSRHGCIHAAQSTGQTDKTLAPVGPHPRTPQMMCFQSRLLWRSRPWHQNSHLSIVNNWAYRTRWMCYVMDKDNVIQIMAQLNLSTALLSFTRGEWLIMRSNYAVCTHLLTLVVVWSILFHLQCVWCSHKSGYFHRSYCSWCYCHLEHSAVSCSNLGLYKQYIYHVCTIALRWFPVLLQSHLLLCQLSIMRYNGMPYSIRIWYVLCQTCLASWQDDSTHWQTSYYALLHVDHEHLDEL